MMIMGTSSGSTIPLGLSKIVEIFFSNSCAIVFVFLLIAAVTQAAENRLGTSLTAQQDLDDNYLMSPTDQQTLSGFYLKPKISYRHDDGFETFSADLQDSSERYNHSEYNVDNPAYAINYQRVMERATLSFGYDALRQSTRISEFKDSGNAGNGSTNQQTSTATAAWQYQLSPRNSISMNGSMQTIGYESAAYADLKNNSLQLGWQSELSDRLSFYTVLSESQYESKYEADFYVVPQRIQSYLLCPPNSLLVSEIACISATSPRGDAVNATTSPGLQAGLKWNIQEQLKFSLGAGVTHVNTVQTIKIPEVSVQYGPPIDQEVFFGGQRSSRSESKLVTTNMNLTYLLETTTFGLTLSRKMQPSSTGSLLRIESLDFSMRKSLSEIDWIEADFTAEKLLTIDEKIIGSSSVNRNIFQGTLKYGYRFSNTLVAYASMSYKRQEANENDTIVANSMLGALAISYTPKEWMW